MVERAEESRKLFEAYQIHSQQFPSRLGYTKAQLQELAISLGRIGDNPTSVDGDRMEIGSIADRSGRKLVIINHQGLHTHELRVVAAHTDKLPKEITGDAERLRDLTEPYGPKVGPYNAHMMRLMMVNTSTVGTSQYDAMAKASMMGEGLPRFGLRRRGKFSSLLRVVGLAAVYDVSAQGGNRYTVTVDRPGQEPTEETLAILSRKFIWGSSSYLVLGRVANVGRQE